MSQRRKKLRLLNTIGVSCKVSEAAVKDVENKFIQTVCCRGKEEKDVTETNVRLHKQIKTKTSQSLPPDETLMLQTFKRILYEVYYWSRVDEAIIFCCKIMVGSSTMRMMKFVHYDLLVCF